MESLGFILRVTNKRRGCNEDGCSYSVRREAGAILNDITPFIHRSEDEYQWVAGC